MQRPYAGLHGADLRLPAHHARSQWPQAGHLHGRHPRWLEILLHQRRQAHQRCGELIDLTPDSEPTDPNGAEVQSVLGASDDGSYVYFAANGVLTSTPNARGEKAALGNCGTGSGTCNLYLWHDGAVAFIAQQSQSDNANWSLHEEKTARVTPDGQTLLFRSQRQLTGYENNLNLELYLYRVGAGQLTCVSCNPTEAAPLGGATLRSMKISGVGNGVRTAPVLTRNLSANGDRVFFETADKLVLSDTNGDAGCPPLLEGGRSCQDVYEWEAKGSGSCASEAQNGGCLYLLSTGTSSEPSYFADASASGDDALFFTVQPLVGQDKDRIVDIYDARVGGGIASQSPLPVKPSCEGEACKAVVPTPPATQSPATSRFSGPGNQKPSHQHKKKKKRHGKKKQHKKQHKKKRAARKHG